MEDNIEKVTGPMLVRLLEERQTLAAYFYDGSMTNDVRLKGPKSTLYLPSVSIPKLTRDLYYKSLWP